MTTFIQTKQFSKYFTCPSCPLQTNTTLKVSKNKVSCRKCKKIYPVKNNILRLVNYRELNSETKRELKGNSFPLTKKNIEYYATKDKWSSYYNHFANLKLTHLIGYLNSISMKGLISLGSGTGYELKEILKRKHINLIFSSDLSFSATSVVPITLKDYDINLCLFTSDLNRVPVVPNDSLPILIYEALHHTEDIHLTIEKLLQKGFKNILFVEPSTNFIIRILAIFGLAQREEYSGLKPDFLDIPKLRKLSKKYKYKLEIRTLWDIPEEYFRIVCKKESLLQNILLQLIDFISQIGNIFQFGSFAIVSLERTS